MLTPVITAIHQRIEFLEELIRAAAPYYKHESNGQVKICGTVKKPQIYAKGLIPFPQEGAEQKYHYVSKKHYVKACKIIQRDYALVIFRRANEEVKFLKDTLERYPKECVEDVYPALHPVRQRMIRPLILPDEVFVQQWQERTFERPEFYEDEKRYLTDRGEYVRSKSELIIANELFRAGIPYHYEVPIRLKNGATRFPDFLVLNRRTRKEFPWEHLGRMDSIGYVERNLLKIQEYEDAGYLIGDSLLITMEGFSLRFTVAEIRRVIETYLV